MVEWRCATRDSGEQCAMTPGIGFGIPMMQKLSADSLVLSLNVRQNGTCSVVSKREHISMNE